MKNAHILCAPPNRAKGPAEQMRFVVATIMDLERDTNGVISVATDLNRLLREAGYTVLTATPRMGRKTVTDRIVARISRMVNSAFVRLLSLRLTVGQLERVIAGLSGPFDAIIVHDLLAAEAALRAAGNGCPVLLFCHFWTAPWTEFSDAGYLPEDSSGFRMLKSRMQATLGDRRITLLPVSERNARMLRQIVPDLDPQRIAVAYPGVASPEPTSAREQVPDRLPVIINVGKVEKRKNQRILPQVAAELQRLGRPCRFLLAGPQEPDEAALIRAEAQRCGVADQFSLPGALPREEVLTAMAGADLYLHTSLNESFGMTLVEAMAAGTPVMALEYEALQEIMPDTPEMIIPVSASPADIASRVAGLLNDRSRLAHLQQLQTALFQRRFSQQAFRDRVLEIISAAAERKR